MNVESPASVRSKPEWEHWPLFAMPKRSSLPFGESSSGSACEQSHHEDDQGDDKEHPQKLANQDSSTDRSHKKEKEQDNENRRHVSTSSSPSSPTRPSRKT